MGRKGGGSLEQRCQFCGSLSGNTLKILAGVSMILDHMGLILFPQARILRILGRISFPIFAFMIAQGCQFTRSRLRYFLTVLLTAIPCQAVFSLATGSAHLSVLVTFSVSIGLIWVYQAAQEAARPEISAGWIFILAVLIGALWMFTRVWSMDYGFWGCLLPLLAALPQRRGRESTAISVWCMVPGMLMLCRVYGTIQGYCLLAVPLLLCYSGRRGKWRMKYFFYILYPAHLAILQAIAWLMG